MGKKCAIEGCKSGTSEDYNKQNRTLKKTCLFQVPKNPHRRQLWSAAMKRQFTKGDCVCEYHFQVSDIKKEDVISLSDGTTFVNPLEKCRLKPTAIPTLQKRQKNAENIDPQNKLNNDAVTQGIEDSQQQSDTMWDPPVQNFENFQQANNTQNNMWDSHQGSDMQILREIVQEREEVVQVVEEDSALEVNTETDNGSFEDLRSSIVDLSDHDYATHFKYTASMHYVDSCPSDENQTDIVESATRVDNHLLELSDDEIVDKDANNKHPQADLTFEQLRDHLEQTRLPKTWSWAEDPIYNNCLLLHQFDPINRQTKMIMEVHYDLFLTLCTNDEEVRVHIDKPVDSLDRFNTILKKATRLIACRGTEFVAERRSVHCEGFIRSDADFLKRQRIPRCPACFRRRKLLQTRNRHRAGKPEMLRN